MTVVAPGGRAAGLDSADRFAGPVHAAEALLTARAGAPVRLTDIEELGGSGRTTVVRARVSESGFSLPRSLVIKTLGPDEPAEPFRRELASYKFANTLSSQTRPGPQLIASDADSRVLVLSDLGVGRSMLSVLAEGDLALTTQSISAWGQALGRMHAATVGGESDYGVLARQGGQSGPTCWQILLSVADAESVLAEGLEVQVPDAVAEMLAAGRALFDEGDHRAFTPADVGPENILLNAEGVQFLDYEWGGFRDAALDIAYAVVTFPRHLGGEPAADAQTVARWETAMVDAWRSEVEAIWPVLGHDRDLNRKVTTARLLWVWMSTVWLLDEASGSAERAASHTMDLYSTDPRVIVARWRSLAAAAARAGLDEVGDFAELVAGHLDSSWLR
ncbi:hypothetical protein [Jongsikchunia kroppenstedtii]|uniref:hypothetical protein n=1 Tax=Jongsikchunia kroppenstedtii TaxID=1121721 RepID=UPI0004766B3B|nr:hypothetical protein [Jongsikchunia kroppenstedtii]